MRLALCVIALECALVLPTILLAARSATNADLATTVISPVPGAALTVVAGEIRNVGKNTATNVQVQVRVFDTRYGYLFTRSDWTHPADIKPGSTASFGVGVLFPPLQTGRYELRLLSGWR
jgi:hypothetical protein